jgi:hypothetical protein
LKKLNIQCEKARRQYAAWKRWQRKSPQNRVIRRWMLDDQGRRIGATVVGLMPEPRLPPLFSTREKVLTYWSEAGKPLAEGRLVDRVTFTDLGIPGAYRRARMPSTTEEQVPALALTPQAIRSLAAQAELPGGTQA